MKKHHNQRGEKPRVKLAGGPLVDQSTLDYFEKAQRAAVKAGKPRSIGMILDDLVKRESQMRVVKLAGVYGTRVMR